MSGLEGLGISANVIGVLVFGLQAAKFISESVSKYQDAEDDHRRFLDAIQRLVRVLTDVNEILQSKEDRVRYSSLYNVSKKCEDELVQIHKSILEWTGSGSRSKTVRTWKKFKLIFMGDNSKRWLESLESHYGFINFQLNRIQRDDLKEQKATTKRIETIVESVSEKVSIVSDIQMETLVRIDHVETNITQQIQTNTEAVKNMDASVNINFDQMNGTLGSIDSLVKLFANTQFYKTSEERERDEVAKATGRIFHLGAAAVTRKEAIVQQEQMEQVLGDIGKILEFGKAGQYLEISPGRLGHDNPQQKGRKLQGLLASSDSLAIGYDPLAVLALNKRKFSSTSVFQWDQKEFSLRVSESLGYDTSGNSGPLAFSDLSRSVTKISYLPKVKGYSSIIDIYLSQVDGLKLPIYAGLSFRAILPGDSEILVAIWNGEIDKVRYLIGTKQANINDCDIWGQSLLTRCFIRANCSQPPELPSNDHEKILEKKRLDIAKYLIEQGPDLNHVDNCDYDPLAAARSWFNHDGAALLLESGANPLVKSRNVVSLSRKLDEASWIRFLGQVCEFYDINDHIVWDGAFEGRTLPLLHHVVGAYTVNRIWMSPVTCTGRPDLGANYHVPPYDIKGFVRKLVRSGARTVADDGESCLHTVLAATGSPDCVPTGNGLSELRDLLLFLVGEIGMDVRGAIEDSRITIMDTAFMYKCPAGRCIWPVWVEVLRELGYNPLEVAEGSLYYEWIKSRLTSRPTDYCCCTSCQALDEQLYFETFTGENETNNSSISEDASCTLTNIQAVTPIRPLACADLDFFERLSMEEEGLGLEDLKGRSATVSDWLRILEDCEYAEGDEY